MKKALVFLMILMIAGSMFAESEYVESRDMGVPDLLAANNPEWVYGQNELSLLSLPDFSASMTVSDSIEVDFDDVFMDFYLDTIFTATQKLDGSTDGYQYYPSGIVVDPEGKIWVGLFGGDSREFERKPGDVINLRGLHCFMPDGNPAPFSPIEFLEFDDGTKDTLYAESLYNGSSRGLTMMDNGNILYTAWSTIYKIDYRTGEGIARWYPPKDGFMASSMTEPAYDPVERLIYVGHISANRPIYMLDRDLCYIGTAVENVSHLHRSIVVRTKSDGTSQLFSGSIWNGQGIFVYESPDALFERFEIADTLGNEIVATDTQTIRYMAWPSCMDWYDRDEGILMYGNYMNAKVYVDEGTAPEAKHASQWVFLDVDEDCQLGTFGESVANNYLTPVGSPPYSLDYPDGTLSPRGAAFYNNTIYTVDFDLNMIQTWTIASADEPMLMSMTVRDSTDSTLLTYGWAPNATNGYDEGLDEYDSLIAPPGSFDVHFSSNLIKDVREPNYTDSITWSFDYRAGDGNGPIVIEWDSTAFPPYGEFVLRDTVDGSYVNMDMRENASCVVTESGVPNLKIVFTYIMSADFAVDTNSGQAPLTVNFSDNSAGNIRSWNWDFGDGKTSRDKNPMHVYEKPGTYDVTLTVSDGINDDVITKTDYITVVYSEKPGIVRIKDAPNDQGGWVYLDFTRSLYDTDMPDTPDSLEDGMEMYTVELSENGTDWIAANSTVAYGADQYSILVHTLYDSCALSSGLLNFRVVAGMTEGNYVSGIRTGYSVDNIAPPAPTGLQAEYLPSGISIIWDAVEANDIKEYHIYRSSLTDVHSPALYATTSDNSFTDTWIDNNSFYFYSICAVDVHDNVGPLCDVVMVEVGVDAIPDDFELAQNYPNPFNPTTTLTYGLPEASDVSIVIYDIQGKKVMEWNVENQNAGWHNVIWNGTNAHGSQVSTGMYIYSLRAGDFSDTKKMVLMK